MVFAKVFKANTEVGFLRELLESDRQQMLSCSGFKMTKNILSCTTSCVAKIFCVHDSSNEAFSSLFRHFRSRKLPFLVKGLFAIHFNPKKSCTIFFLISNPGPVIALSSPSGTDGTETK